MLILRCTVVVAVVITIVAVVVDILIDMMHLAPAENQHVSSESLSLEVYFLFC